MQQARLTCGTHLLMYLSSRSNDKVTIATKPWKMDERRRMA